MAYTQTDIDTLKKAIATGVLRSRVNGRETEFRSLADMRATLAMMVEEVAAATTGATKPKQYRFVTRSGMSSRGNSGNW